MTLDHDPSTDESIPETDGANGEGTNDTDQDPMASESTEPAGDPDELTRLQQENQFLLDQVQRTRADLANFKRRTADERIAMEQRVTSQLILRFLPIVDDLEKALAAERGDGLHEGVSMVVDKILTLLRDLKIEPIPAIGEPFDPNWHDAMFHQETEEHPEGHVLQEYERGYRRGDELIRASRVIVAKSPGGKNEGKG